MLFVTTDDKPTPPEIVNVSVPRATVSVTPESAAIERLVEIVAVVTPVTKPLAFTVITGIAVEEPYVPTLAFTVARVNAAETFALPSTFSNAAVASPVKDKLRGVDHLSAESAEPVIVPIMLLTRMLPLASRLTSVPAVGSDVAALI